MKKILVLFALIAIAGLASINAHANHNDFYGFGFSPFGYGYGFGGYGYSMAPAFNMTPGFNYGMTFAGFNGFNYGFTAHTAVPNSVRKIVPIPATASANTSISYDADGNIHVRPFDDEDLFVED